MNRAYSPYSLSRTVWKLGRKKMKKMELYNLIYRMGKRHATINIDIKIVSGSQGVLPVLDITDPSTVIAGAVKDILTIKLPRFSPVKPLFANQVLLGERSDMRFDQGAGFQQALSEEMAEQTELFNKTRLYMGMQGLAGEISMPAPDGNMQTVASWNLPDTHKPDRYTGSQAWTHADSDPKKDLDALKDLIMFATESGVEEWIGVPGRRVMNALQVNERLGGSNNKMLSAKEVRKALELDHLVPEVGWYVDPHTNVAKRVVGTDEFLLVGWAEDFFCEEYLDIRVLAEKLRFANPNAVPSSTDISMDDMLKMMVFSDIFVTDNPSTWNFRSEAFCLPSVRAPGATGRLLPIAAG